MKNVKKYLNISRKLMKIPIVILTKYRYEHYKKLGFLVKDYQAQIFNDLLVNKMFNILLYIKKDKK